MASNFLNKTYISGEIAWIKYYPDCRKVVFLLRNPRGSFYVELSPAPHPEWMEGDMVFVEGALYSSFNHGKERTRIEAESVKSLPVNSLR